LHQYRVTPNFLDVISQLPATPSNPRSQASQPTFSFGLGSTSRKLFGCETDTPVPSHATLHAAPSHASTSHASTSRTLTSQHIIGPSSQPVSPLTGPHSDASTPSSPFSPSFLLDDFSQIDIAEGTQRSQARDSNEQDGILCLCDQFELPHFVTYSQLKSHLKRCK
jgi:hypothetical protein